MNMELAIITAPPADDDDVDKLNVAGQGVRHGAGPNWLENYVIY